jgi:hypothetical protein
MSFACLECCKAFKRQVDVKSIPEQLTCPQCGGTAHNFGRHFKPPRQNDSRQWEKIRFLFGHGFRFQKIRVGPGHHDTVAYPETLEEAKRFVAQYESHAFLTTKQSTTRNKPRKNARAS